MKLIRRIAIEGYRSIANEVMDRVGDHTVLVGKNSSGKSNTLRALSLFLNDPNSMDYDIDFDHDLYYRPSRRRKKQIRISVDFCLPVNFKLRKGVKYLEKFGSTFSVEKVWELDNVRSIVVKSSIISSDGIIIGGGREASDFLSLIKFRYIATRSSPSDIFDEEASEIASALYKRMRSSSSSSKVIEELEKSAKRILSLPADALRKTNAPISEPTIVTGKSLLDMMSLSGFQANGLNGVVVRDRDWGSGHQEFFLLNLLHQIDTDYSREFGWKQACVWALEEPESSLHYDLQASLARQLMTWSTDTSNRLQIFTSTHSPVITMSGDAGYAVDLRDRSSRLDSYGVSDLVRLSVARGVSAYIHPVLTFPFNVVVLVEGETDAKVLTFVAEKMGESAIKFVCLPQLDGSGHGGFDNIIKYLARNRELIKRRPVDAPLVVLADWDVSDMELAKARAAYGKGAAQYVLRADATRANPMLADSFRGIERYYPETVVREAHDKGSIVVGFPATVGKPWSVSKGELGSKAKVAMMDLVISGSSDSDLTYLKAIVAGLLSARTAKPAK